MKKEKGKKKGIISLSKIDGMLDELKEKAKKKHLTINAPNGQGDFGLYVWKGEVSDGKLSLLGNINIDISECRLMYILEIGNLKNPIHLQWEGSIDSPPTTMPEEMDEVTFDVNSDGLVTNASLTDVKWANAEY